jgi:DNA polymerase-4
MTRLIFHIDVNSAFLSWEAARRVANGEEDLRLIPSAVSGDPSKRTSIITAKSIPAKAYNIQTGEPLSLALRKCPELVVVKPDFNLYRKNSKAFMDICREYAPCVEKYSIDECFLDMTGTGLIYPDPYKTAIDIKNKIRDTLGFTVNVGIGSNKLLAKMASDFEKPDKVHTLYEHEIKEKMWPLSVGDLFTVGKSTAEKLVRTGITTIGELAAFSQDSLIQMFGEKMGKHLHEFANGIDESPVSDKPTEAKSYGNTVTLETNVDTYDKAYEILLGISDLVTFRMRADKVKASCVTVTIRDKNFHDKSHQRQLLDATDITNEVYENAKSLFNEIWDGRTELRLLGISLSNLDKGENEQISLFNDEKKEKARKLDAALDQIRNKYGTKSIKRGTTMGSGSGSNKW